MPWFSSEEHQNHITDNEEKRGRDRNNQRAPTVVIVENRTTVVGSCRIEVMVAWQVVRGQYVQGRGVTRVASESERPNRTGRMNE